jgi:hypothetical protein
MNEIVKILNCSFSTVNKVQKALKKDLELAVCEDF